MGFFAAVGACYANIFNFSGRARRAEYWWFFLFQTLVVCIGQAALVAYLIRDPQFIAIFTDPAQSEALFEAWLKQRPEVWTWAAWAFAGQILFLWLPHLSVTFRRLHDTGRSGWFILMPFFASVLAGAGMAVLGGLSALVGGTALALAVLLAFVPLGASVWFFIVLCLPGTRGNNRWGGDPIPFEARRPSGDHPAFASRNMDPRMRRQIQAAQRAEFEDYYNARVLPAITRPKPGQET